MWCRIQFVNRELTRFKWCKKAPSGVTECGEEVTQELNAVCSGSGPVTVFLHQQDILMTKAVLPPRAGRQQLAAIGYAVEEQIADDVDDGFFALMPQQSDNSVPLAVIDREIMDRLQEVLAQQHVHSRQVLPQMYQCPVAEDADWLASVCPTEGGFLVRYGQHEGLFCSPAVLNHSLNLLRKSGSSGNRIDFYGERATQEMIPDGIEFKHFSRLDLLSQEIEFADCINLKQQEYQSSHAWLGLIRRWRWPAAVAALVALALIGESMLGYWRMDQQYSNLLSQQQALLKKHLPQETPGDRPKDQLVRYLSANQSLEQGGGFLGLLHEYSRLKNGVKNLTNSKILYQQGQLVVNIETRELQSLDALREKLPNSEYPAVIENINIKPERTTARLILGDGQ